MKGEATKRLNAEGIHPFGHLSDSKSRRPKCFARGEWKVFLDTPEDIQRSITYVEANPIKEGKKAQHWSFVVPYETESPAIV